MKPPTVVPIMEWKLQLKVYTVTSLSLAGTVTRVYWHTEGSFLYVHSTNIYFLFKKGEEQQNKN